MSAIPCSSVSLKTMADGTLRISFDIEPMHAQDAFKLFASPGTPAALAALQVGYMSKNDEKVDTSAERVQKTVESVHDKPKGGPLAKLAGMWCGTSEFCRWAGCNNPDQARKFILDACEIGSRAELDHNEEAAEKFHTFVRGPYSRHLIARGIVA